MINNTKSKDNLTNMFRSEVTFWLTIIGIVVSVVIAFSRVDARVSANEATIVQKEELLKSIDLKVDSLLIQQTEIRKDVEFIKLVVE